MLSSSSPLTVVPAPRSPSFLPPLSSFLPPSRHSCEGRNPEGPGRAGHLHQPPITIQLLSLLLRRGGSRTARPAPAGTPSRTTALAAPAPLLPPRPLTPGNCPHAQLSATLPAWNTPATTPTSPSTSSRAQRLWSSALSRHHNREDQFPTGINSVFIGFVAAMRHSRYNYECQTRFVAATEGSAKSPPVTPLAGPWTMTNADEGAQNVRTLQPRRWR